MDKENVTCAYKGILFSPEKEGNSVTDTVWMNLGEIMLCEINQSPKDKYRMIPLVGGP